MNTIDIDITITPEQQEELRKICQALVKAVEEFCDAFCLIVQQIVEKIRQIAIELARFFLKQQLLEWRVPHPVADWISRNIYWYWAVRLGFAWFQRKLMPAESY